MSKILDGKATKDKVLAELKEKVKTLSKKPHLAVILVGDDPASEIYVREKEKAAKDIGVAFELIRKNENISQEELENLIKSFNSDPKVTGIVVQKPLPAGIDNDRVDRLVEVQKDVDGLHPSSDFYPTTATGVLKLLKDNDISISGKDVVVVGKSRLSGLPTALVLLESEATVTICHLKTKNLKEKTLQADILVVSAGSPNLIKEDMVQEGAVVIDVGTNRMIGSKKIVGDVDFEKAAEKAFAITPVPGGVGPMIVAGLFINAVKSAENQQNL